MRQERRALVCVHGIGVHSAGFSDRWWKALSPHVGETFGGGAMGVDRFEVLWSDIVNRASARTFSASDPEQQATQTEIEATVRRRRLRFASSVARELIPAGGASRTGSVEPTDGGAGDRETSFDDFLRYMFVPETRLRVLERFERVVRPLAAQRRPIDILAHSWGTVLAYEGLLRPGSSKPDAANLFTIGAALSIDVVRRKLRLPRTRPPTVRRWFNLNAKGDGIGGALARRFDITSDYLDLEPVGCVRGLLGYDLSCTHASYFRRENTLVNAGILAHHIKGG